MNKNRVEALKNKFDDILWRDYLNKDVYFSLRKANYKENRRIYVKSIVIYHEDNTTTKRPVIIHDKNYVDNILIGKSNVKDINIYEARSIYYNLYDMASIKLQRYMKDCEEKSKAPTTQEILDVIFGNVNIDLADKLINSIWSKKLYQVLIRNAENEDLFADKILVSSTEELDIINDECERRLIKPEKSEEKIEVTEAKVETKTEDIQKEPVIEETKANKAEEVEQVEEELNVDFEKMNKLIVGIRANKELVYFGDLTDDNRDLVNITNDEIIILNSTLISTFTEDEVKFMFDRYLNIDYIKAVVDMVNTVAKDDIETWTQDYLVKLTDRAVNNVMYDINEVLGLKEEENFEEKGE
jgi:hypothetical protein